MGKYNGCIYLLSARTHLLKKCLGLLYENYNNKFDYPVYVYHFDDIYYDELKNEIKNEVSQNIHFIREPYGIPDHIKEEELFHHRDNNYARKFAQRKRIGYLHMENFVCNIQNKKGLEKYDYHHRIDDDSWFKKPISFDLFEEMIKGDYPMATSILRHNVSQNTYDVRENLFEFTKNYCEKNNIIPKSKQLRGVLKNNDRKKFHILGWSSGNCNLYNMKFFRTNTWYNWVGAVNKYGGCYKHRWGDQEIIGLFTYIYFDKPVLNMKLEEKGFCSSRLPSSGIAPSIAGDKETFIDKAIRKIKTELEKIF